MGFHFQVAQPSSLRDLHEIAFDGIIFYLRKGTGGWKVGK
jgi:hypothetical protein